MEKPKKPRGFAAMSPEKARELQRRGGQKSHESGNAHKWNSETARAANAARKNLKEKK